MGSSNTSNNPPASKSYNDLLKDCHTLGMVPEIQHVYYVGERAVKNTIYVVSGSDTMPTRTLHAFAMNNKTHCLWNKKNRSVIMSAYAFFMLLFGPEGLRATFNMPMLDVPAACKQAFDKYVATRCQEN